MKKKGVRRGNPISSPSHKRLHREATRSVIVIGVSLIILLILLLLAVFVFQKQAVVGRAFGEPGQCISPPSGMVAWWTGDGTITSKNNDPNLDLTLGGAQDYGYTNAADGKHDQAFRFNGAQRLIRNNSAAFFPRDQFSIEFWVKRDNQSRREGLISTWKDGQGWFIEAGSSTNAGSQGRIYFKHNNGEVTDWPLNDNMFTITARQWVHYVLTYDGTTFRLYLNGDFKQGRNKEEGASSTISGGSANPLYLGFSKGTAGFDYNLKGAMDEVTIYDRALSADEILDLFNNGKCKTPARAQEICDDGADNDNDQIVDCMDIDCYSDLTCKGNSCGLDADGVDRVVTWSYRLPDEAADLASNQLRRPGCVSASQCVADGGGQIDFFGSKDQGIYSPGIAWGDSVLCFTDQNWYKCNENIPEDQRRKGSYLCSNNPESNTWEWTLLCLPETKYQFRNQNHEICSGLAWKKCENGQVNIADTNVKFTCAEDGTITKKERNCYNEEDDDRDETADQQDADCLGDQTIFLNENEWYETTIRPGEGLVTVITPER